MINCKRKSYCSRIIDIHDRVRLSLLQLSSQFFAELSEKPFVDFFYRPTRSSHSNNVAGEQGCDELLAMIPRDSNHSIAVAQILYLEGKRNFREQQLPMKFFRLRFYMRQKCFLLSAVDDLCLF